jgi:signal peptidase II
MAVDQIIKLAVVNLLKPIGTFVLIPHFLEFTYSENSGAAFGMLQNNSIFFAVLTIVISIVIFGFLVKYKHHNLLSKISCLMIIAGGLGNLVDRLRLHYVVDFIHFYFFNYIFNFADCLVTVGVALMVIYVVFFMEKLEKQDKLASENAEITEETHDE